MAGRNLVPAHRQRLALGTFSLLLAGCQLNGLGQLSQEPEQVEKSQRALTLPNTTRPSTDVGKRVGPVMALGTYGNVPTIVNGALFWAGNAKHDIWNISNLAAPAKINTSQMVSPHSSGEAESHQVTHARYGNGKVYTITISGKGVDIWDITSMTTPSLKKSIVIPGVNYGDYTSAVWGVTAQGRYVFVGGTNTSLHVVDLTADPAGASVIKTVPNSAFGGISAGPLTAIGNLLVVGTPKNNAGVATFDISNPADPVVLDFVNDSAAGKSYFAAFYGKNMHLITPFRSYDVTTDPRNITKIGSHNISGKWEYLSFGEGHAYLGNARTSIGGTSGCYKYGLANLNSLNLVTSVLDPARRSTGGTDDQFCVPIGNLIVVCDDEDLYGCWIGAHQTAADTVAPTVKYVNPLSGATGVPVSSRIGVSFSDQMELFSASTSTFKVYPKNNPSAVVPGKFGVTYTVLNFTPDSPLADGTTYEVALVANGVKDLVGNGIAAEYKWTFTTAGSGGGTAATCAINATAPAATGSSVTLAATNPNTSTHSYSWNFGDGSAAASGTSVAHTYASPGRYNVRLTMTELGGGSGTDYQAEDGSVAGGVAVSTSQGGFTGDGYVDFPSGTSASAKVVFDVSSEKAGARDMVIRFASGTSTTRKLRVVVNGTLDSDVSLPATGSFTTWATTTVSINMLAGANTIELNAGAGEGPNVDKITLPGQSVQSCSVTQVVHRPLTASKPARSSTIIVDSSKAWVVNPDDNTVAAINTSTRAKIGEYAVGTHPRTLAKAPNGDIWVVNQDSDNISVLSSSGSAVATIALPYGSQPYGIAFDPAGTHAFVSLQALGRLVKISASTRAIVASLDLGPDHNGMVPAVRGVAVSHDSAKVLVTASSPVRRVEASANGARSTRSAPPR